MEFIPVKTKKLSPPQVDIYPVLDKYLPPINEGDIILITSKIIAICEGSCILKKEISKSKLIKKEADIVFGKNSKKAILTLKNNTLIPNAGIDESNAGAYYILWPKDSNKQAQKIGQYLKKKYKLKKLAVIITDSHLLPRRRGTLGISIGYWGFNPVKNYKGQKDIFGRKMEMTEFNLVDSIAAFGTIFMGEGAQKTPIVIARGIKGIKFQEKEESLFINKGKDLFTPILK